MEGNTLIIFEGAHSDFVGRYSGELQVTGNEMIGVLETESGASAPVRITGVPVPLPTSVLQPAGGTVKETSLRSPNLETLFLLLTGKELRE